jgi:hypothetical protein
MRSPRPRRGSEVRDVHVVNGGDFSQRSQPTGLVRPRPAVPAELREAGLNGLDVSRYQ